MAMTMEQILRETRQWPVDKIGELVGHLTEDLNARSPEIEAAWNQEIHRRVAEIQSGNVQGIPLEDSLVRICKLAGLQEEAALGRGAVGLLSHLKKCPVPIPPPERHNLPFR